MTDTKSQLKQLLIIVQAQQKVIEKMAQMQNMPTKLEPAKPELMPQDVVMAHLPLALKNCVEHIEARATNLNVKFKPNCATQANLDAIVKIVQGLVRANKLSFNYTVSAA